MLKKNVEELCDRRGWSLRRLACNMSIKKARLVRGLEDGAKPSLIKRIARAFGVSETRLMRRHSRDEVVYTVNDDGSLRWQ